MQENTQAANQIMLRKEEQEVEAYHARMQEVGATPQLALIDPTNTIRLALSDFSAFEGIYETVPYLVLHMCTRHIGKIRRVGTEQHLVGILRPGSVGLSLPNSSAEGYWPKSQMLAIAVNLEEFNQTQENSFAFKSHDFLEAASTLHNDPLLTAVMTSLWRDAEVHGLSSAFFEEGLTLVLNRLASFQKKKPNERAVRRLTGVRLSRVLEFIESRISSNVRVAELAQIAEQDVSSFSQAFRLATGYAPYEYFTMQRMNFAKQLLHSGLSITDVAIAVGYANPSKFTAAFKKINGHTPSAWRHLSG